MDKTKFLLFAAALTLSLSGCGDGDRSEDMDMEDTTKTTEPRQGQVSETFFQVPSPGEMLTFIKIVGGKNNKNTAFLNPPANEKNYTEMKAKALNFGVYSSDLSYCSVFDIGSEALKYFKVVRTLGEEIGVSTAIKPEILKRIERNIGNADSLAVITDDVYFSSFETLEEGQQGPTLALVVAGGWIESIYIATNLAKYEEKSPVIERLADQKYTLENLIEFLKKHERDANVKAVRADFESLLAEFNRIGEKDLKETKVVPGEKGAATLTGGKQLVITEDIYKAISEKIKTLRNAYTQTA